jgi:hypothetical protein
VISEFFIDSISFATLLLGDLLIFIDNISFATLLLGDLLIFIDSSSAALLLGNLLLDILPEAERPRHMHIERSRKKQRKCLKRFGLPTF